MCSVMTGAEAGPRIRHFKGRSDKALAAAAHTSNHDNGDQDETATVAKDAGEREIDPTNFLMQFGYLPASDMETGALRTKEEMERAVSQFQKFANLPVTGQFDTETKMQMTRPRCGMTDILPEDEYRRRRKRYALGPSKWEKKELSFRILNYTPDLEYNDVRTAVIEAFRVWQDVTQLAFYENTYGRADIEIKFARWYHGDGYGFDGEGMVLAHAFFPGDDRGGDVHFDDDELWTAYSTEGTNLFTVAAHEIGHALGLAHSNVPGSLMYPWYQGYTSDFHLHTDDIVAIQYLYGSKTPPSRPPVHPTRPTITTTTTTTTQRPYPPQSTPRGEDTPPDPCTATLDAVAIIRQEIFSFSGNWFWRRNEKGMMKGYPVKISHFWYGFPDWVDHIDAVYERTADDKIVFFIGKRYWIFNANTRIQSDPVEGRPITDLGLPNDIDHIDAAFVWGHNSKTYLMSGTMYWRFNEEDGYVEYDYPRDMSMWAGVRLPVQAAFQYLDGRTYFFTGLYYQVFNDARMEARDSELLGPFWLQCIPPRIKEGNELPLGDQPHSGATYGCACKLLLMMVVLLVSSLVKS